MAEHTPGPWRSDLPYVSAPSGEHRKIVADCDHYFSDDECEYLSDDECEANARLIAAAPELLAALEQALAVIGSDAMRLVCDMADLHGMPYRGPTVDRAAMRNLIAKARGEADPTSEDEGSTT